jgi:DNA-binding NarL/FixJ family response regulator
MLVEAIELVLGEEEDLLVAGTAATAEEAVGLSLKPRPDVILLDVDRPGMDAAQATRAMKAAHPECPIVLITASQREQEIVNAIAAGAHGYLPKTRSATEVAGVIRLAASGEMVIPAQDLHHVLESVRHVGKQRSHAWVLLNQLTDRERDVLGAFTKGMSTSDVSKSLSISPQTVRKHVKNMLAKLNLHSKVEAVIFAIRHGFPPDHAEDAPQT